MVEYEKTPLICLTVKTNLLKIFGTVRSVRKLEKWREYIIQTRLREYFLQRNVMPFVKDTSYRDMPFSSESPSDDFHRFVTVSQLIDQMNYRQNVSQCRTVGTVSCDYGEHVIHELDDSSVRIRLSLAYTRSAPPFTAKPYTAQLFGSIRWKEGVGPVIQPQVLQSIPVSIALRLRDTMKWVNQTHIANYVEAERKDE